MFSPKRNPAVHSGGVGFDLPGGLIDSWIAEYVDLLKTTLAALARVDAAIWAAALFLASEWGSR
jgi:hypothetical protein